MPRKVAVNIHDALVEFCMTAPLVDAAQLLKTATSIVKVRSLQAEKMGSGALAAPGTRHRPSRPSPALVPPPAHKPGQIGSQPPASAAKPLAPPKPPRPPVRPPTGDDQQALARASTDAKAASEPPRRRGPRKPVAPPPMAETAAASGDAIPDQLPPQDAAGEA